MKDFEIKYYKQKQTNMADTVKKWWQSKTIWGVLTAAAGLLLAKFGVEVTPPENADFNAIKGFYDSVKAANGNIASIISIGMEIIGFGLAFYGRITAGKKIG